VVSIQQVDCHLAGYLHDSTALISFGYSLSQVVEEFRSQPRSVIRYPLSLVRCVRRGGHPEIEGSSLQVFRTAIAKGGFYAEVLQELAFRTSCAMPRVLAANALFAEFTALYRIISQFRDLLRHSDDCFMPLGPYIDEPKYPEGHYVTHSFF
jgi:hypothetical protein